ncbi:Capreomycidine synthase [Cyphellophora attinorum]|uniref:Capreomycidine synthase n=1 Tax=Cyphellophora attinorum TaxID=1664694 RepID=A0A0N1GXE4_9EURO|nr:Capreomycidine synthase [Phialophora attinorum]KPI34855.1 Capreomycidine synthase [Phialophora attinorum]
MKYKRMAIEIEAPEESGAHIQYNLSESSTTDRTLHSLGLQLPDLTLLYTEHRGTTRLRQLIVEGTTLQPDDVLVTAGAAGALFIIATSQLSAGDHLLVMRPNYASNLETPRATGCDISFIDLQMEDKYQPNLADIEAAIRPNTKLISITCPHNPTGTNISLQSLKDIVALAKRKGCLLLVDETYHEIHYGHQLPIAASLGNHVISVSSMSKSWGLPGIRIGWLITQNKDLQTTFLAAKEQISISGSVIDEWIAEQILSRKAELIPAANKEMAERRSIVEAWVEEEPLVEWVKPVGGAVCFPRMKEEPIGGTAAFYDRLLQKYSTYVGLGHWFERPDTHFRIGFGWPSQEELRQGLENISKALRDQ